MRETVMQVSVDDQGAFHVIINDQVAKMSPAEVGQLYDLVADRLRLDAQALRTAYAAHRTVPMSQVSGPSQQLSGPPQERETGH